MRESVEGIPQVHLQQQQQQQQAQQQQMHPGVPSTGIPGLPQHLAGGMPHYAMQTGMAMAGGQQYAAVGLPIQYYQVAHPGAPGFAQMVPNYQFGTAPQFMHGGEWEDEYDEGSGAVLYGNLEVSLSVHCNAGLAEKANIVPTGQAPSPHNTGTAPCSRTLV